jgi:hypothetical protein
MKRKDLKDKNVIATGYCNAQYLLKGVNRIDYIAGVYGWSCDVYYITEYNVFITSGYRPVGKTISYDIIEKYEEKARNIYDYNMEYKEKNRLSNELLYSFVQEVI